MISNRGSLISLIRKIALFSLLITTNNIGLAGIYKWVDENGGVHYGEQRPSDANSRKVQVEQYAPRDLSTYQRPGSETDDGSKTKEGETTDDTAADAEKKTEEAAKPEKKPESKADKKRRLAACSQARSNLERMKSIGRVRSRDKDGNVTYMSQKDKEAKMSQARSLMSKHCK